MNTYSYAWDPFREIETMLAGVDRLCDRAWTTAGATPGINVYADEETAVVTAEVPGIAADAVQVQLHGDNLIIGAQRHPDTTAGRALVDERAGISFSRSISLPFAVDPDHVEARLADGILAVSLKRAAADRPRRINVNAN